MALTSRVSGRKTYSVMRDFARAVATCQPLLLLASCRAFAPTAGPGRPEGPTMTVLAAVRDQAGTPLEDAVVTATALDLQPSPAERPPALVTIENYAFKPAVLPVRVGTAVSFRNRDGNSGFQFISHDAEHTLSRANAIAGGNANTCRGIDSWRRTGDCRNRRPNRYKRNRQFRR